MRRIFQLLSAAGFLAALVFFAGLALSPPGTNLGIFANWPDDKFGHFGAFFLLGPLAAASLPRVRLLWISIVLMIIGAAIEFGQTVTGREASLEDFAANSLGLLAGLFPLAVSRFRLALNRRASQRADMT